MPKIDRTLVPDRLYASFVERFPLVCTDIVFLDRTRKKVLLFRRKNRPARGAYFAAGGRVFKNESLADAVVRKTEEETGIRINPKKLIPAGILEEIWNDSRYPKINSHTVVIAWAYELPNADITLDAQHDDAQWFSVRDPKLHPYIKERLKNIARAS